MHLKSIEWFRKSVRDIRGYRVEDWSDFGIPQELRDKAMTYLNSELREIVEAFEEKYGNKVS